MFSSQGTRKVFLLSFGILLLVVVLFLGLALSPLHHWDEFFYLYAMAHHSPGELLSLESGLADSGLFSNGYFAVKISFLSVLRLLILGIGEGLTGLRAIEFIFALVVIGFVAASYGMLREVFERDDAARISVVLLFLPLTMYFAYKVLSEPASMMLMAVGAWAYLRSFRRSISGRRAQQAAWLLLAAISVLVGMTFRLYTVLFFVGLVAGLLVLRDERFPWKAVILRAAITGLIVLVLLAAVSLVTGINFPMLMLGPLNNVMSKETVDTAARLYAFAMFFQLAAPFLLLSVLDWRDRRFRFSLIWLLLGMAPFVMGNEPRYYYNALVPVAILVYLGLARLVKLIRLRRVREAWVLPLLVMAVLNRLLFTSLQPYEINQREYVQAMSEVRLHQPDATVIIPWISDYAFLRFAYPDDPVKLSLTAGVVDNSAFESFIGVGNYIGQHEALNLLSDPLVYIGWSYNPVIIHLRDDLAHLGIVYIEDVEASALKDHRAQSWMWNDPTLSFVLDQSFGMYEVYDVQH